MFLYLPELHSASKEHFDVSNNDQTIVCKLIIDNKSVSYITAIYGDNGLYVRLFEVLDQLGYKYYADWQAHSFSGSTDQSEKGYRIKGNNIFLLNEECSYSNNIYWNEDHDLYVNDVFFKEFYNTIIEFNISELAVHVKSSKTAPFRKGSERDRKLEYLRSKKEFEQYTNIDTLERSMARINSLSYSLQPNFSIGSNDFFGYNILGSVNGELLKGVFYLGYNQIKPDNKPWYENLRFNWEKYDFKTKLVKSVVVSHTYANLITKLYGMSSNFTISNTSDKSNLDKTYTFKGNTTPYSDVEIYNNGNIIDYVTADSLGNFTVYVPITGSENNIKAISYNEFGVPVELNKLVYVPYGLIKKNKFIYLFSGGVSDYGDIYLAPTVEYGLTSWINILLGNETIFRSGRYNSFSSNKLTSAIILGTRISPNKYMRFDIKYSPKNLFNFMGYGSINEYLNLNLTYEYYNKNNVINFSPIQNIIRLQFAGNLPKFINGNYMMGLNYTNYRYNLDASFSGYIGFNTWFNNFTGNFTVSSNSNDNIFSDISLSLKGGYYFNSQWYNETTLDYRFGNNKSFTIQDRLNFQFKNKLTVFLDAMYQFGPNQFYATTGITWRLPFMQVKSGIGVTRNSFSGYINTAGSIMFQGSNRVSFSDQLATGATLKISLFVDANNNGKLDKGEPLLPKPKIKIYAPVSEMALPDGVLYSEIQPNKPFKIYVPQQIFSDISWQMDDYHSTVMLSSHQSRTLFIPVQVLTEISGRVYSTKNGERYGISDIGLIITNKKTGKLSRINCDDWGEYVHMGLSCGEYTLDIDPKYLELMNLCKEDPSKTYNITIKPGLEGGQLLDFDFVVKAKQ